MKPTVKHSAAIESFYHLQNIDLEGRPCQGLACFAARKSLVGARQEPCDGPAVYCLGRCYNAPVKGGAVDRPECFVFSRETVLSSNLLSGGVRDIGEYIQRGGGQALHKALSLSPQEVIHVIEQSGLRGRGGAGFPTGKKWRLVAEEKNHPKFVIANADEGDPGAYGDRMLMEDDPFRLIEALVIAGRTVGAEQGFIYLRKEYPAAASVLQHALEQARDAGWIGKCILGTAHRFDLTLVIGAGSYLCGEETALLNALEGKRPEPRLRPPQITSNGLHGLPTLVNNVETLAAIPWIVNHGAKAYAALGTPSSSGTKLLSLNSLFNRPGLYEVEFGISLRDIVSNLGKGLRQGRLWGIMVGGPLATLLPPSQWDTALDYEKMQAIGASVGHGGVIAFTDNTAIADLLAEVMTFGALESCGKCTPCHLGTARLAKMFESVRQGERLDPRKVYPLVDALAMTSLCGHGKGLAEFLRGIQRHFPTEWQSCFQ